MSISKTIFQLGVTIALAASVLTTGCARPAPEAASSPEESRSTPVAMAGHVKEEAATRHELIGVWWGTGVLDQTSVAQAVEGLSPETQRQVSAAAESFLATEMAIEFKVDGQMETAVEVISQTGQRESGMGIAAWEATPTVTPGEYRVSAVEVQADGSSVTDHKTYRVSTNGQQLTLLVDLPGLLGQCNPRIVLQRQEESPSVASGQGDLLR
ncbi:hypothetical protein [Mariniblastus fucicola]|uniref:Lipocalin-like domain-containing protein n=1 Tax=Mariniblastus fucicola TaxID=980251 RepID=A0A5B9PQ93_9BACT|nr:hypothetical protein [Mariniblastus fucicola]QEG24473.1 hypothetical protein MFFC18_43930 [Mariniblastus fucicola]